MKKIKLNPKYIKRIIVVIAAFVLMLKIGIIATPISLIKWHFNTNKQSFQNIVNLMNDKDYDSEYDLPEDEKLLSSDFIKIRGLFSYGYIQRWVDNRVDFCLSNIVPKSGEAMAIVYSKEKPRDEEYGAWGVEYRYCYEDSGGNWYLEYRDR